MEFEKGTYQWFAKEALGNHVVLGRVNLGYEDELVCRYDGVFFLTDADYGNGCEVITEEAAKDYLKRFKAVSA